MSATSKLLTPQAPMTPSADEALDGLDRLVQRHGAAPVQQIEVDALDPQPLEAARARLGDAAPAGVAGQHLAHHEQVFAAHLAGGDAVAKPLSEDLLRAAVAVHLGGVEQPVTDLHGAADGSHFVAALTGALADPPRTETEGGDAAAAAQGHVVHGRVAFVRDDSLRASAPIRLRPHCGLSQSCALSELCRPVEVVMQVVAGSRYLLRWSACRLCASRSARSSTSRATSCSIASRASTLLRRDGRALRCTLGRADVGAVAPLVHRDLRAARLGQRRVRTGRDLHRMLPARNRRVPLARLAAGFRRRTDTAASSNGARAARSRDSRPASRRTTARSRAAAVAQPGNLIPRSSSARARRWAAKHGSSPRRNSGRR